MDFVKAQFDKIKEQLAGLNASQRMLAASLAVIMVMTLLWWSRYAGTSEMEDLLPQDLGRGVAAGHGPARYEADPAEGGGVAGAGAGGPPDGSAGADDVRGGRAAATRRPGSTTSSRKWTARGTRP